MSNDEPGCLHGFASIVGEGTTDYIVYFDDPGTYTFRIEELDLGEPNWEYDDHSVWVDVIVTEDPANPGKLLTKVQPREPLEFTNTYFVIPYGDIKVTVEWEMVQKPTKPIPKSVDVILLADGKTTETQRADAAGNWQVVFENLPFYKPANAKARAMSPEFDPILYTLAMQKVDGFNGKVTGSAEEGYTITYTAIPVIPVTGDKTNPLLLTCLLLGSAGALNLLLRKRRKP